MVSNSFNFNWFECSLRCGVFLLLTIPHIPSSKVVLMDAWITVNAFTFTVLFYNFNLSCKHFVISSLKFLVFSRVRIQEQAFIGICVCYLLIQYFSMNFSHSDVLKVIFNLLSIIIYSIKSQKFRTTITTLIFRPLLVYV